MWTKAEVWRETEDSVDRTLIPLAILCKSIVEWTCLWTEFDPEMSLACRIMATASKNYVNPRLIKCELSMLECVALIAISDFFFFFFFFFFAFPSYISGVHHFWVRFLRMWPFLNPTIKVVTFRLRGWCVLGVFLLPAFTRLGHERQDLLSPCDEMHVCTD